MPAQTSTVSERLAPFGTTIFAEMTALAIEHGAVNLSQGFPDFDGPAFIREAAARAMQEGHNQYAPLPGVPVLREAIAGWRERTTGDRPDAGAEITVTSGCTEALAASMLGLVNPGDEVVLFEPFYDSYLACVRMAGATPRVVTLRPPAPDAPHDAPFTFDPEELRAAFGPRTKAVLVNTPHNPTGKVFTRDELAQIAALCAQHDAIAISDEVYERLVYDGAEHVSIATFPGMRERTVVCSSVGKTFSYTGWKVGWAIAPERLTAGVRAAHQFLTFAVPTPLQHGVAAALREDEGEASVRDLVEHYTNARDFLLGVLREAGLRAFTPQGSYFILADHAPLNLGDDVQFCRTLTAEQRVAAIPPSAFYANKEHGRSLARFAFCKRMETLHEAARRLAALHSR
ncbi:MAG: aminotransferase class I/II-fold pyridoxal phosphate-dependent enzyme [Phycisphaerales bacterium]|nr:MAG: aminotransferase class I/II-fold pyridoxal phosphate-dependent enzyme [Phycisphaerales bacterium]